ncbi:hypothetical protein CAOG_02093, partial [Capsaspora owczarzaki ATCC 30864]
MTSVATAQQYASRLYFSAGGWLLPNYVARQAADIFFTPRRYTPPEFEQRLAATSTDLAHSEPSLQGIKLYSWGRTTDPAVILVHGWEGRGTQLGYFVEPLVKSNRRVIAIDMPNHGKSVDGKANAAVFGQTLKKVAEVVASGGNKVEGVIGHSMGAGATLGAIHNGLLDVGIRKVVLIGGPATYHEVIERFGGLIGLANAAMPHLFEEVQARVGLAISTDPLTHSLGGAPLVDQVQHSRFLLIHDRHDKE